VIQPNGLFRRISHGLSSRRLIPAALLGGLLGFTGVASAIDPFTIEDIRVEGLTRISAGTVFNYLPVQVGDVLDDEKARASVRALFRTGFFKDVRVERDGNVLILVVEEREAIASVTFEGNKAIKTEDLEKGLREVGFAAGEVFNEATLDRLTQELQRQYFSQGKYGMTVDPEVTPLPGNRVDVRVVISEGQNARIKEINIVGNSAYKDKELLKRFELKKPNILSFFTRSDQYSQQKLSGDLETLRSYYLDDGYINFSVDSAQVSITPDKKDVYITINITEGARHTISDVKLAGRLIVAEEELFRGIFTRQGMVFSRRLVTDTSKYITDRLGNEGYAFANVNAIPEINRENNTVSLTYFVDPGQRVYVRRISFIGNAKTRDEVLRREMRQLEGGWISTGMVERSKTRLMRLGFFEEVNVETPAVPGTSDQVDVQYTVEEQPSGNLLLGVGYSQIDGLIFNANISQQNFLGSGKSVSFAFNNSSISRLFRVGYLNPYWTIDGVARGFDLRYQETDASDANITAFNSRVIGGTVNFGVPVSEFNYVTLSAGYDSTHIAAESLFLSDIVRDFLAREGDTFSTFKLGAAFAYDTRNAAIFPDRGVMHRFGLSIATPGGDLQYYKVDYDGRIFIPLIAAYTLSLKTQIGYGNGYGQTSELPFFEHFYAGGPRTVRGYEENSLGPQDDFGNSLGGNLSVVGNAELIIPLPFLEDVQSVRLTGFFDVGNVFGPDDDVSFDALRMSTGISAIWLSPFGLISVSFAKPFNDQPGDETQAFQFSFGTSF
jgi:outer membrane protein insertion porin family